jgi:hypothetical protein
MGKDFEFCIFNTPFTDGWGSGVRHVLGVGNFHGTPDVTTVEVNSNGSKQQQYLHPQKQDTVTLSQKS